MIKKRVGKLLRLGGLIGIRQGYKLFRNWYQIYYEPEIVIDELRESRDKSQIFLIILTSLTPLFAYLVLRVIWDLWRYKNLVWVTGKGLVVVLVIEILIYGYLGFYILRLLRRK